MGHLTGEVQLSRRVLTCMAFVALLVASSLASTVTNREDPALLYPSSTANQVPVPIVGVGLIFLTVWVNASGSYDPDGTIMSYSWDWGDQTQGSSGVHVSHTYEYPCSGRQKGYPITLTIQDDQGATASKIIRVRPVQMPGDPPWAGFTHSEYGLVVTVDGSPSYDNDGTVVKYAWNWGDGTTIDYGMVSSHAYSVAGTYVVRLTVTDNTSLISWTDLLISVEPCPAEPIASFVYSVSYLTVTVDASASYDPDGVVISYAWDWEDGSEWSTGVVATHTYATDHEGRRPGFYLIDLVVMDDTGMSGYSNAIVPVYEPPKPPVAVFVVNVTDLRVALDASSSYDPDGTIVGHSWDFGDGTGSTGSTTTHDYAESGEYTITLTVTDNSGLKNTTSQSATVQGSSPPHASFSYSTFGLTISTNARSSADDDGSVVGWVWSWGDGATSSGVIGSHTYSSPGTYAITLTVTDDSGLTDSTSLEVTMAHLPPVASFTMYGLYLAIEVYATDSYDSDGSIADYAWNWGDGSVATHGLSSAHVYAVPGSYSVTLTVTDSSGVNSSLAKPFSATAAPLPTNQFSSSRKIDGAAAGTTQRNGAIVAFGANLYAAWEDRRDGRGQIYISKSTDRGVTWSAPAQVNVSPYSGASQQSPSVAVGPDGAVYVAWQENRSGGMNVNVYLARSNAGSLSFGPAVRVDDTGIQFSWQEFPTVAVNSKGIVLVVWKDDRGGYPRVYCARSVNRGDSFSANLKVDDAVATTVATGTPSLAVDDVGRFYIVWNDNRDSNSNIYLSRSTDDGITFQSSVRVDDTGTATYMQGNPSVSAAGDGFVCAVWRDGRSGLLDIYSATSNNGGVSFGVNVKVASASAQTDTVVPKVAVDPWKNIFVIWETINSADSAIRFSMSTDLGATFQKDVLVSDAPNDVYCTVPQLAVDTQGGVHVLWTDDRNDEGDVQYSFGSFPISYARQPGQLQTLSEGLSTELVIGTAIKE